MVALISKFRRGIALFLMFVLLNINFSCYYYTYTRDSQPTAQKLDQLKNSPNYIIVHQADQAFHLRNVTVDQQEQTISGSLQALPLDHQKYRQTKPTPGSSNRYKKTSSHPGEATPDVINEVHFYLKDLPLNEGQQILIPLAQIEKIEVYDPDTGATTASFVLGGIAIAAGTLLIIGIIIILTKSSCPFVYVNNGDEFVFAGEIYSGAIFKSLERDDYLALPQLKLDSVFEIKVSNKLKEQQFINQLSLLRVTHPVGTQVLPDQSGTVHLIKNKVDLLNATVGNADISTLLKHHDSTQFTFNIQHRQDYFNEVVLTFPKPKSVKEAHLILTAKNSLWGDYVFGEFTKLFGSYYSTFIDKQNKLTAPAPNPWAIEQGLAMKVFIGSGNNWTLVDTLDLVGPLAYRDLVVPIDLSGYSSDLVKIKLSAGFMMWDLDYVGINYSNDENIRVDYLNPSSAITKEGTNALISISKRDENYLAQKNIGDEVYVNFSLKTRNMKGMQQDYILHTRGYYNHVRDYSNSPEITKLLSFKKPGRFSRFSKEKMDEMNALMSAAEISASLK